MILNHYFLVAAVTFLLIVFSIPNVEGAAYIKFDGVDGETQDKDHKGWSDLNSLSQELYQLGSEAASSRTRGDVVLGDIIVVKELDKSSPKLAESVATGKVFPKVEIQFTQSSSDSKKLAYYAYELKNVMITSYSFSGGSEIPTEDFSFHFEELKGTYTEIDSSGKSKGTVVFTWNKETGIIESSTANVPQLANEVTKQVEEDIPDTKEIKVPGWIKAPVGFWSEGLTSDTEFKDSIQYMIKEGLIVVPKTEVIEAETDTTIPAWVKGLAGFWSQGQTSDTEFVNGLQYLISKNIIKIGDPDQGIIQPG